MTDNGPAILLVDDETGILDSLRILLKGAGFRVTTAGSVRQALELLDEARPDLILSDIRMPGGTGLDLLSTVKERDPELPVVLMTAQASLQSAVRAVNEGAFYYIQKPFSNDELLAICKRAAETGRLKQENRALKSAIRRLDPGQALAPVGNSRSFQEVLELARTVAPTDSTVLMTGESGTGKEVLARYLHSRSDRADGPFLSINCGALPESLLESELFGHVKGAFTGAVRDRTGLMAAAEGGTFFLDEIGEMTPATQVKLLRALQEREVTPVGASEPIQVDVRIIAATNRDLEEEIRKGRFRSDLYYRLNVIALHLPPLRDRPDDIPLLARHFLERMAPDGEAPVTLSQEAMELLMAYPWPGNVRELENALERAAVLTAGGEVGPEGLPERIREAPSPRLVSAEAPATPTLEVIEQAYIQWVLAAEGGNKTRTAEVLGIDPSTLYRKLSKYESQEG